jgi:hypothetical protein
MRLVLVGLAVSAGLLGCGGGTHSQTSAADAAAGAEADSATDELPSIIGSDATPKPAVCMPCALNGDCESGAACVASDGGHGYCAPGCNKEGYCTPDRTCERVLDPDGVVWAACLPLGGCEAVP